MGNPPEHFYNDLDSPCTQKSWICQKTCWEKSERDLRGSSRLTSWLAWHSQENGQDWANRKEAWQIQGISAILKGKWKMMYWQINWWSVSKMVIRKEARYLTLRCSSYFSWKNWRHCGARAKLWRKYFDLRPKQLELHLDPQFCGLW